MLARDSAHRWREAKMEHAAGIASLLRPSAAQARLQTVVLELSSACVERTTWRALTEEYIVLAAVLHAKHMGKMPETPQARARWMQNQIALREIATFDPKVRSLLQDYGSCTAKLTSNPETVKVAREMLTQAIAYHQAIAGSAHLPPGLLPEGPEFHAREMVRSALEAYVPLLPAGVYEQVLVEVLGDTRATAGKSTSCPRCGAPLPEASLAGCTYCGAVTRIVGEDAWIEAQVGLWAISREDLARKAQLDGLQPVIAVFGGFLYTQAAEVSAKQVFVLLQRTIAWVSRNDLFAGLDLLVHAAPQRQTLLSEVRTLCSAWVQDTSARPVYTTPLAFLAPSEADEEAWVDQALAFYRYRGGSLLELLAQALSPVQIAAVSEQATSVTAGAAMKLFERAKPGLDCAAMLTELERLRPGYDVHPRVAAFTFELAQRLSHRSAAVRGNVAPTDKPQRDR
jgi:hypothetical protein